MTETLPRRDAHAEHRDTRNIKRLLRAMRRDPSTLSVDEMSCVCAVARMDDDSVIWFEDVVSLAAGFDATTRYRVAELVRADVVSLTAGFDATTRYRVAELVRAVGDE